MSDQPNDPPHEKRRFGRIPFNANVLISQNGKEWRSKLFDISFKGLMIETPKGLDAAIGERFHLEVIFTDSGSLINGNTSVAYVGQSHIGLEIMQIDVESAGHLRRLVELNLGDQELLERELTALHWH